MRTTEPLPYKLSKHKKKERKKCQINYVVASTIFQINIVASSYRFVSVFRNIFATQQRATA